MTFGRPKEGFVLREVFPRADFDGPPRLAGTFALLPDRAAFADFFAGFFLEVDLAMHLSYFAGDRGV